MMDFSYFDFNEPSADQNTEKPVLNSPEQLKSEYELLKALADNVGLYQYAYNDFAQNEYGYTNEDHNGIVAQELQKVPGLESAVIQDDNGTLKVDTNQVALAALGYVSALARVVMEMRGDFNGTTADSSTELSGEELSDTDSNAEGNAEQPEPASDTTSTTDGTTTEQPVEESDSEVRTD